MPLDPINRSGPERNTSLNYPRNDTVPSKDKAHYPSTLDRSSVTKDDPHYRGDNARNTFPNNPPPYETSGERFSGTLDFGLDSDIWQWSDAEIRYTIQSRLAKKHHLDPRLLDVVVNRHLGKINYDYRRFLQSDRRGDSTAYFDELEVGEDFIWTADVYNELNNNLKKRVPPEAIWIKDTNNKAHVKEDQRDVDYEGNVLTFSEVKYYWMVERVYEKAPRKKPEGMKITTFDMVIDGGVFIFVEYPQELAEKKLPWNMMFTKEGHNAEGVYTEKNAEGKERKKKIEFKDLPDKVGVYTKEEYEKIGKYQKEDLDDVFDYLIRQYKTSGTKTGVEVAAPRDAVEKVFTEFNIPWAKFNSMSDKQTVYYNDKGQQITEESAKRREKAEQPFEEKELWHGNWGKYAWVMDDKEIRISRRK